MYKQDTFPNSPKTAQITPVYKKGDRLETENYRPISVTPTLAKNFERLLLEQLTHRLNLNSLISKNQFGFQKQKPCLDTMILLTEQINQCVDENEIVVTFVRLSKGFQLNIQRCFFKQNKKVWNWRECTNLNKLLSL